MPGFSRLAIKHSLRWRVKIMGSLLDYSQGTGQRDPQPTCCSCSAAQLPSTREFVYFYITISHLDKKENNTPISFGLCTKKNCHQYWLALRDRAEFKHCRLWNPSWCSLAEIAAYLWHVPMFKLIYENCEINILTLSTIWWHTRLTRTAMLVLIVFMLASVCAPLQIFLMMKPKYICFLESSFSDSLFSGIGRMGEVFHFLWLPISL